MDRKVIEVSGALLTGLPKGCKRRKTIYPVRTPQGYPLAEKIGARIQAAGAVAMTAPIGPTVSGQIPAIVATLATDGRHGIGFNE